MSGNKFKFFIFAISVLLTSQSFAECAKGHDPKDPIIQAFIKARNAPLDKSTWPTQGGLDFSLAITKATKRGAPDDISFILNKLPNSVMDSLTPAQKATMNGVMLAGLPFPVYLCKEGNQLQFQFVGIVAQKLAPHVNVNPEPDKKRINLQMTRMVDGKPELYSDYVSTTVN